MFRNRGITFLIFCLAIFRAALPVQAQFYTSGQAPAAVRWQQLLSPDYRVVFADGSVVLARKYAHALESVSADERFMMGTSPGRLNVLLHPLSARSNAWVAWAPARMEILPVPPQDMYAQAWHKQLALHELRHVVQLNAINQGTARVLSHLFGEQATGLVLGLHIPRWLLEGDAIWAETVFSNSGRLRDPFFLMPLDAQWGSGRVFSYDKAVFGSFRDFVPDHYVLGARLTGFANTRYGDEFFYKTLRYPAMRPWMPGAFAFGLRKQGAPGLVGLYENAAASVRIDTVSLSSDFRLFKTSDYCSFTHPVRNGGKFWALRQKPGDIPRFVSIDKQGRENTLFIPGFLFEGTINTNGNLSVFTRLLPDLRWAQKSTTAVTIFSHQTGQMHNILKNKRLYAPAVSPDHKLVAAVAVHPDASASLEVFRLNDETPVAGISVPEDCYISQPVWMPCGTKLISLIVSDRGKALASFEPFGNNWQYVSGYTFNPVYHPAAANDTIYFSGAYNGKGQIFAYSISKSITWVLTQCTWGADFASPVAGNDSLVFSEYTPDGFKPRILPTQQLLWLEVPDYWTGNARHALLWPHYKPIEGAFPVDSSRYLVKSYRKAAHLFNIHSYGPVAVLPSEGTVNPGFVLHSQNLLGTMEGSGGYEYAVDEGEGRWFASLQYSGWYPVLAVNAMRRQRKELTDRGDYFRWQETDAGLQVLLPLNLTSGIWARGLGVRAGISGKWLDEEPESAYQFQHRRYYFADYLAYYSGQMQSTAHHIYPRWGHFLRGVLRTTPFKGFSFGSQWAAEGIVYTPGFGRHDGLRWYGGYERRSENGYGFSRIVQFARGHTVERGHRLYTMGLTYRSPLLYPDLALGPVMYCKRLYGGFFGDYTRLDLRHLYSVGAELYGDFHLFRLIAPVVAGLRGSYLPGSRKMAVDFFMRIDYTF